MLTINSFTDKSSDEKHKVNQDRFFYSSSSFFGDEDISFPAYEDLLEDFENAIKSYDSSQAREILRKVMGMKEDYYNTRIKGNSRAHK